jgi:glycosyltransferase involved in cell wall biosynthesis
MAMAQPVVAFDTPVSCEYLADWGVYAPLGDSAGLAEAIRELAHDERRRMETGRALRERAQKNYSWQRAGKEIEDIYRLLT